MSDNREHAFPVSTVDGLTQYGMTLRDYFATHCSIPLPDDIGLAFEKMGEDKVKEFLIAMSQLRYAYADAMLQAREVKP